MSNAHGKDTPGEINTERKKIKNRVQLLIAVSAYLGLISPGVDQQLLVDYLAVPFERGYSNVWFVARADQ